ncbi:MAG: hypothetical protein FJ041_06545, partial [Candidatus Cloacimonetes bacterium]|nr:hypothetical protein [Candidatus Cloacimonadota bacterium]
MDTGIQGNFVITGGNLVLGQDSSANVDLNANITINNSGTVKIKGGNGNASRWAYLRDASLTMSGGTLDFSSSGINIGNYGHTFNDIITGGTIKTIGDFKVDYGSFYPAGGTIELYGSGNAILHNYIASSFYNVKINKTISRENERSQIVTIDQNTSIDYDLTITSGTLALDNATLTIGRNLDVSGTLLMDEADEIIDLAGNATWEYPAVTAMTGGTMYVGGNWFCDSFYTDAIGAGFNLVFDGSAESTIIAEDYHAYLGTLTINKTGSGCKFLQQSKDFIVKGNITVNGTSYLKDEYTAITVNGTITIQQNGSMTVGYQYTSTARITTNGLNIGGTLTMTGGSVKILSSYIQQTTGVLTIEEGGSFTLDTPYTGTYHSFAGVTTLNGGNFKITNNGMQFGASSNFTANDGVVLLGWGLRALTSGTFQQTSGTFEFIGNRSCDIQLASDNWFNNLTINKTGTPADVYLSTNVTVKKDLNIVAGNLLCFHHLLTVNWDVVITGGVLNAGYSDDEIKVGRNWNNHVGPSAFIEGNGRVTFFSNLDGKIYHNENFNNLKMNKEIVNLSYLSIYTDVTVNVSGTVDLISGTLLLRDGALFEVAGDMNISGSRVWNYFLEYEMMIHVGGVTSIASSAEVLLNNGSLECDGILNLYGKLDVGNGLFTLHGDFVNLSNSILNINNGRFICTAPYASAWQNINGHFALTGASGIFEFQDRGIQLTSTFDGQISGGKIRTGRGFLATTQNIFRPTGGTLEFFGELAATLTCSNGNWINDLSISKTNAAIVLGSG